jgi:hypothetical protein
MIPSAARRFALLVLCVTGLVSLSIGAKADSFSFQDWGKVEGPIYHWNNAGTLITPSGFSCQTGPDGQPCFLRLGGTYTGTATVYNYVIYDTAALTTISDLLMITTYSTGGLVAQFESDQDADFGDDVKELTAPGVAFTSIVETGNDQFVSNTFNVNGYTGPVKIGFRSDGGPAAVVPEPSSMVLFGSGLSGLAALIRRRKTAKQ